MRSRLSGKPFCLARFAIIFARIVSIRTSSMRYYQYPNSTKPWVFQGFAILLSQVKYLRRRVGTAVPFDIIPDCNVIRHPGSVYVQTEGWIALESRAHRLHDKLGKHAGPEEDHNAPCHYPQSKRTLFRQGHFGISSPRVTSGIGEPCGVWTRIRRYLSLPI